MEKLSYFRIIYEYEKQYDVAQGIKDYIHGNNPNIIKDLCSGDLHLPSPFLLDEIEWSLDITNPKVKAIIYQLKITSRAFYLSLIEFEPGSYRKHFDNTSASFGRKMICALRELQMLHIGHKRLLWNQLKMVYSKVVIFLSVYPNMFRAMYVMCTGLVSISSWYLCSLGLENTSLAILFPSIMGTITAMGVFAFEHKLSIFERIDITGKNLLAIKYREFVMRLKNNYVTL